jgi:dTDP-glucose pyrophosphorylase
MDQRIHVPHPAMEGTAMAPVREDLDVRSSQLDELIVHPQWSLRDAVARIDASAHGIALVVDAGGRLTHTITDGDIRRAMLTGVDLSQPVNALLAERARRGQHAPITAPVNTSAGDLLELMQRHTIRQVPLIDEHGRVADLVTMDMLLPDSASGLKAVVMAGGQGQRLQPLTLDTPKPMLPVGGRPILEHIIGRLRQSDIHNISISTNYLAEKIEQHFGNGEDHEVHISYLNESQPLGTAGALGLMETPDDTVLVMNGDILTNIDFAAMHAFHREHNAAMTVAVGTHKVSVPYGVVECENAVINNILEKPTYTLFINAGIYLLEPALWNLIPRDTHFNMTDLIDATREAGRIVSAFPIREYWLDIGQMPDYERAQAEFKRVVEISA